MKSYPYELQGILTEKGKLKSNPNLITQKDKAVRMLMIKAEQEAARQDKDKK